MLLYRIVVKIFLLCQSVKSSTDTGRFFNPADNGAQVDYSDDDTWTIGDTETIKWTTTYSNYTIALWQQILPDGPATLGNIIFQTTTGAVTQSDWVVQLFDFDLDSSNVFFLWIHEGLPAEQGLADANSITSRYVNFTLPSAATKSTSTSGITTSSKVPASSVTSSVSPKTSSTSTTAAQKPAATSAEAQTSSQGDSVALSAGAQAGIGLGAALIGLAAIICSVIFVWRSRKKHSKEAQQPTAHTSGNPYIPEDKVVTQVHSFVPKEESRHVMGPAELSSDNERKPSELIGDFPGQRD
ncbi:hypothetical protein N0V93_007569 [Gnomoniopsis smithogilvyi]|uniref:Mid2 domain-containing protein n=1 Tax=Gnomoniopsis smithogilvyi TaxID=1191159 RepID=A0A9W9CWP4_9PEZI|nr:hypothetical protein N0V93_007569 [Gnomoniopsis smithogilvyi]